MAAASEPTEPIKAYWDMHTQVWRASGRSLDAWRSHSAARDIPEWRLAEYGGAGLFNAALWSDIPIDIRRALTGNASDRGVDAFVLGGNGGPFLGDRLFSTNAVAIQVKWYSEGRSVGHDAIARLNNVADAVERALVRMGVPPEHDWATCRRVLVLRQGTRLAANIPGLDRPGLHILWKTDELIQAPLFATY